MNLEISHDLLASQIRRRFPSREENRRRSEKLIKQNYALHLSRRQEGGNFWLDEEDLVFITPFLGGIDLNHAEASYVKKSRRKADLAAIWARGKWILWIGTALLALLVLTGSISMYQTGVIEEKSDSIAGFNMGAIIPNMPAKPITLMIDSVPVTVFFSGDLNPAIDTLYATNTRPVQKDDPSPVPDPPKPGPPSPDPVAPNESAAALKACNNQVDSLEKREYNYILRLNKLTADLSRKDNLIASLNERIDKKDGLIDNINHRNDSLQKELKTCQNLPTNPTIIEKPIAMINRQVDDLICQLKYDKAYDILADAGDWKSTETVPNLLELAYFYLEAGQTPQAAEMLGEVQKIDPPRGADAPLSGKSPSQLKKYLNELSIKYNLKSKVSLEERYFPDMVRVDGGNVVYRLKTPSEVVTLDDSAKATSSAINARLDNFEIGKYEITSWQYNLYCTATGKRMPNLMPGMRVSGDLPVVNITWLDAIEYCNWLSEKQGLTPAYTGKTLSSIRINWDASGYRLPTEMEWTFAAAGGRKGGPVELYAGSDDPAEVAWYEENSQVAGSAQIAKVGGLAANELGLYDMSGNAWEWCWDSYDPDYIKKLAKADIWHINPRGPETGEYKVLHGGSYALAGKYSKIRFRGRSKPMVANEYDGFRVVKK
ncbi:MAG: SUMF1/EgtB/PvdO family nonheme iron enzyme [Bacteroidia bacterium]